MCCCGQQTFKARIREVRRKAILARLDVLSRRSAYRRARRRYLEASK